MNKSLLVESFLSSKDCQKW